MYVDTYQHMVSFEVNAGSKEARRNTAVVDTARLQDLPSGRKISQ